jgi:hypothetical protein
MPDNARKRLALAMHVLRTGQDLPQARSQIPAITPQEVAEAKIFFPMDKFFIFRACPLWNHAPGPVDSLAPGCAL